MNSISARLLVACLLSLGGASAARAQGAGEDYGQLGAPEPEIAPAPGSPSLSRLQPAPSGSMDNTISVMGIFSYFYVGSGGVGLGGRYQKTVVPQGFLHNPEVKDDLGVEGSFEFRHYPSTRKRSYDQFLILAGAVWNFWFSREFALYPKLGLGFSFGSESVAGYGGAVVFGAVGAVYQMGPLSLRGEVGSDSLQLGVGFTL